jgi:hypothetical protein
MEYTMRPSKFALLVAAAAAVTAAPVSAHAHLVRSSPAINAAGPSPQKLALTFSERLVPTFSKLQLIMPMSGRDYAVPLKSGVTADGRTLVGVPQSRNLMKGAYLIRWTAATADGHRTTGTVPFRVK